MPLRDRIPAFLRSIRFRLALTYSLVVFGLLFITIAAVNYALTETLDEPAVADAVRYTTQVAEDGATYIVDIDAFSLEQRINQRALDDLRRFSFWALLVLFPVSIWAGWLIADRTLRPIGRITAVAKEIQATDLARRIDLGGPEDELRELADTFDAMLGRVEAGVESQRAFIQDTSHELRNPLAVMAANLDVVLSDPNATEADLRSSAEIVRRTVDRASRSVDDLAVFARRDVPQSIREQVALRALAEEVVREYRGPLGAAGLDVEWMGDEVVVSAELAGVKRALANLVNNAVRLTRPGSSLRVGTGEYKGFAWLGVDDQGPGIDPRDHQAVFQRFWSGDDTSLRSERRSGLGLAIAKQIAQAHGGELTVRSVRGAGAAFVLWLPTVPGLDRTLVSEDGVHPAWDPFL